MATPEVFPAGITVFERGWLSSNNILLTGRRGTAVVDTGYSTHATQTVALVSRALGGRSLDAILNTHLHSDHCGGNAALKRAHPSVRTSIPPGLSGAVREWDVDALTYEPTGQSCERFAFDDVLQPGALVEAGDSEWEIHAAPGHDPHSIILFEPHSRTLISADALWENGFGVVFPELEGDSAFDDVGRTLDLIEALDPRWIVPGHGSVFTSPQLRGSLDQARSRLDCFIRDPARHARHAAKVLLKFKLLEVQAVVFDELLAWALRTPYFNIVFGRYFENQEASSWIRALADDLVKSGVARVEGTRIVNV